MIVRDRVQLSEGAFELTHLVGTKLLLDTRTYTARLEPLLLQIGWEYVRPDLVGLKCQYELGRRESFAPCGSANMLHPTISGRNQPHTMMVGNIFENLKLVPQHSELMRWVEAMLSCEKGGESCLDISLLIEQLADSNVYVRGRVRARHCSKHGRQLWAG